ncbi:DNA-invertase hin [Polystyrenella longa]|uniref:DNA-invertase hin n=1 Tax=Polystyrenella longa TaxID=2528007 RepID=A0A518CN60_9PLAN|nr:recombinase family protein [Polystyrenella longa]QDU80634.1 DNA-invertase hin [Polystyrenella longa]
MIDVKSPIRCAIYTRKSTDEGLDKEFNSLDAQRESSEAYIASQKNEGWLCLPARYDDGGFTGANMERPALRRLLNDIEAGKIDCIVVYKVDRLSRSLMDFSRIVETFDKHGVSFVSVTQQFNTTSSMGRLTLNILLSFAQFEREIISERTRDKMAAARRKGKYVGGAPILGYDIDRAASRLVVNELEAIQDREIFDMYLDHQSLLSTANELTRRGIGTKEWTTKKGTTRGGAVFNKTNLYGLLTNVAYIGKTRYKDELFEGEHDGIVDPEIFEKVQGILKLNCRTGGKYVRNKFGALLKRLLYCTPCDCGMVHSITKKGNNRYRYYVCSNAQKRGWTNCPTKSVPAAEIEAFVINQIRAVVADPSMIAPTLAAARSEIEASKELKAEQRATERDLSQADKEIRTLVAESTTQIPASRLADLHDRIKAGEQRLLEIDDETELCRKELVYEEVVSQALQKFDPIWENLSVRERVRLVELLIERVDYDGVEGTVSVTFHPTGIMEFAEKQELVEEVA